MKEEIAKVMVPIITAISGLAVTGLTFLIKFIKNKLEGVVDHIDNTTLIDSLEYTEEHAEMNENPSTKQAYTSAEKLDKAYAIYSLRANWSTKQFLNKNNKKLFEDKVFNIVLGSRTSLNRVFGHAVTKGVEDENRETSVNNIGNDNSDEQLGSSATETPTNFTDTY